MAAEHELSIDVHPASVDGARDDLHRMVLNLLENAVRHTPPGTQIRARTGVQGGVATLIIEDDGPGITPELARRVFDRFVRGAGDGGRGSGLGLSIVRAVAESHGGSVVLGSSETGSGTRFVITVPTHPVVPAPADGGPPAPDQTSTTTGNTIGRRRSRS
jgi:signal transduction histidine kinase